MLTAAMILLRTPAGAASSRASTVLRASLRTHIDHDASNKKCGHGIGGTQLSMPKVRPSSTSAKPSTTTPLDQISVEKWSASASSAWLSYFNGNPSQSPRPPKIDSHRDEHYGESRDAGFDFDVTEEHSPGCFVNDPDTSQQQEAGFDEGGKILYLAMTVLVIGIGGFVGDADRKKSDQGGNKIERRSAPPPRGCPNFQ